VIKIKKHVAILLILISAIILIAHPKNVVIIMGDGMGYNHLLLSELLAEINDLDIGTNKFQITSLVRNETIDNIVTDSAAAATAFLCGQKTKLGYLGMDKDQNSIDSIATILKKEGYKIGLITNTKFSDATPAAMYAHTFRDDKNKIIEDLIESDFLDFFVAGGLEDLGVNPFTLKPTSKSPLKKLNDKGYKIYGINYEPLFDSTEDKFMAFVSLGHKSFESQLNAGEPTYLEIIEKTISKINFNDSLFLFVECGRIDHASHINDEKALKSELIMFQKIVDYLTKAFSPEDTLFIIFADHETGGLSLMSSPTRSEDISISWNTTDHTATYIPFLTYGNSKDIFPKHMHHKDVKNNLLKILEIEIPEGVCPR
jgi:alkaline phosphatase